MRKLPAEVELFSLSAADNFFKNKSFAAQSLDTLSVQFSTSPDKNLLCFCGEKFQSRVALFSDLFKSNCQLQLSPIGPVF